MRPDRNSKLTGIQLDVMEVIWGRGSLGATVAEIWQDISCRRRLARTTVLTMVVRLEKRGWLKRTEGERPVRFLALRNQQEASGQLAKNFLDEFFGGSALQMVTSLLGSNCMDGNELARLHKLLSEQEPVQEKRVADSRNITHS